MQNSAAQFERTVLQALRNQTPVRDLPGVRIRTVRQQPEERFDISFELESGKSRVLVFGEIKPSLSPKLLQEIAPWIKRMKALRPGVAFALIAPTLSPRSQAYSIENGIDFLDLDGNISINVRGTFTLQRLGMRSKKSNAAPNLLPATNVFSGRSSRVLRSLTRKAETPDLNRNRGRDGCRDEENRPSILNTTTPVHHYSRRHLQSDFEPRRTTLDSAPRLFDHCPGAAPPLNRMGRKVQGTLPLAPPQLLRGVKPIRNRPRRNH